MDSSQYGIHVDVDRRHWWWRARREILRDTIARYAPRLPRGERLRLAEVGFAGGGNLPMLASFGDVIGAEANPEAVAAAARSPLPHVELVQHRIPEPLPRRCHVLGLFDVLEHLERDQDAMAWACEQLEPGGIAVVTVPAFQLLWTEQDEVVHHFRRYTPASLRALAKAPLEVLHLTCFNSLLFLPILVARTLMRALRPRGRAPRSHLLPPREPVNELLYRLFRVERHWVVRYPSPLGVSVMLVVRRRAEARA